MLPAICLINVLVSFISPIFQLYLSSNMSDLTLTIWTTSFLLVWKDEVSERGEWKSWLKAQHSENEDHGILSHHFMGNSGETVETVSDFIFLGSKITEDGDCNREIKRHLLLGRKVMTSLDQIRSDQSLSGVWLFATPRIIARQASLSITNSWSSLRLTAIESVMPSSHLILCHPLLLLPPIPPNIRVFSTESTLLMRWPKYWSFSFSIIPSKEIPGWSPSEWTGPT